MNKPTKIFTDADNRVVVTRGRGGGGKAKQLKGVNCMATDGNFWW